MEISENGLREATLGKAAAMLETAKRENGRDLTQEEQIEFENLLECWRLVTSQKVRTLSGRRLEHWDFKTLNQWIEAGCPAVTQEN